MDGGAPLLEVRAISKGFPGVTALERVSLTLGRGEVLAVIGENGAGKSTLMKVLAGVHAPDSGTITLAGRAVSVGSPREAVALGIALIHQELCLAENLSAGANVFLGREPARFGRIDHGRIAREAGALLASLGASFGPQASVAGLAVGERQLVEVAKALSVDARVLIMDEPTSSLGARETEELFRTVRALAARGVSVLYVSHRLGEVEQLADRVLVLRDGRNAGELPRQAIAHEAMVRLMVGRDLAVAQRAPRAPDGGGAAALVVRGLVSGAHPAQPLDLELRPGELVGIAGLVGAGRSALLEAIFGVGPRLAGEVEVRGRVVGRDPRSAIAAGLALVPEDRVASGLFLDWGVPENLSIAHLRSIARAGRIDRAAEARLEAAAVSSLGIRAVPGQPVGLLSGGNQQKVVLGKWLATDPAVLLLDEPTRGIDAGARGEVYALLERLAAEGVAVLFASSEMEEILALPDRVLVMHEGRIAGELSRALLSEQTVMRLATGSEAAA